MSTKTLILKLQLTRCHQLPSVRRSFQSPGGSPMTLLSCWLDTSQRHSGVQFPGIPPRHSRCLVRTTWLFRDGSWSKAEDKVDMRALGNKTAKLDSPAITSLTIFERGEDDPQEVPDSDRDDSAPEVRSRSAESLKAETLTPEHMFTHRPKEPWLQDLSKSQDARTPR